MPPKPTDTRPPLDEEHPIHRGRYAHLGFFVRSTSMRRVEETLARVAPSDASVLLTGENGTGKELVARALHRLSNRAAAPWVAINCSAFNDNLLESELFGHRRGAFTGAVNDKKGLFSLADGGTFFFDEVGEMSPAMQAKLLRVLQDGVFYPVGATENERVDLRFVAATNRDLRRRVAEGQFREDLYYRLNVVEIELPPLRERLEDIPLLAESFLHRLNERSKQPKSLSPALLQRFLERAWRGNIRELENEIERLWVLTDDGATLDAIEPDTAADAIFLGQCGRPASGEWAVPPTRGQTLGEATAALERSMITDALRMAEGNKTHAARLLGISRRNLIRKTQVYAIEDARLAAATNRETPTPCELPSERLVAAESSFDRQSSASSGIRPATRHEPSPTELAKAGTKP